MYGIQDQIPKVIKKKNFPFCNVQVELNSLFSLSSKKKIIKESIFLPRAL